MLTLRQPCAGSDGESTLDTQGAHLSAGGGSNDGMPTMMHTRTLISKIRWQGNTRTLTAAAAGGGATDSGGASDAEDVKMEAGKSYLLNVKPKNSKSLLFSYDLPRIVPAQT